ncbi:hypothetical protein DTO013E5_491 [Penicillium roqueforti]|uniref:uncharacterized protein n=1 Tax=Penicillium roqueforti TaxID=5082 RepID=UPI00190D65BA|nr:uncharacterized protein LCP9604111_647 [Penicillium roqueforti]KAF9253121.1 hypothetical protein LCP9604111_647 [Penicillium roqueforti]KAI1838638.1 hypothetical protein CBS147337_363 [Penicillium roqueforti]KAI2680461.1 hypothetical protein CBS147355_3441 [Penicillium roqueforti]KAI2691150.1 hypothetical protein LCP963914a_1351 [Penicillium roqueforti]KAI2706868.1 hypothetical protein CBS147372_779 [Penicillium roqueforti]
MALSHIGRLDGYQYAKGRSAVVLRQRWDANFERFLQNSIGYPKVLIPLNYSRFLGYILSYRHRACCKSH